MVIFYFLWNYINHHGFSGHFIMPSFITVNMLMFFILQMGWRSHQVYFLAFLQWSTILCSWFSYNGQKSENVQMYAFCLLFIFCVESNVLIANVIIKNNLPASQNMFSCYLFSFLMVYLWRTTFQLLKTCLVVISSHFS